ncbi:MAG: TrkA family potassium uptake protein [Clostridia bacterium]|nr:TrkA family potassium uptake protein [Clostridia bacterium]
MNNFAIIGAGKFGTALATALGSMGKSVILIDRDKNVLEPLDSYVEKIYCCDAKNVEVLNSLGVADCDVVIVAAASNVEDSAMITMALKELGVKEIIAKAKSATHAKLLKQIGADKVVFPEEDMGIRMAKLLSMNKVHDYIELSGNAAVVEIKCPEKWAGKSLAELNVRVKYNVNVIAIINGDNAQVNVDPKKPLDKDCILAIVGDDEHIEKIIG